MRKNARVRRVAVHRVHLSVFARAQVLARMLQLARDEVQCLVLARLSRGARNLRLAHHIDNKKKIINFINVEKSY